MTRIKLCGLTRPCDIKAANEARPDYVGFVFAKSSRQVSMVQAGLLREKLDHEIQAVGVFVNAPAGQAAIAANCGIIDLIQLHGDEDETYIDRLKSMTDVKIIKAVSVPYTKLVSNADYYLFDQGAGGTGVTCDWSKIKQGTKPFFLAGGLHSQNIEAAILSTNPFAVDVSSGIETNGYKDRDKIIEIVRRVRAYGNR